MSLADELGPRLGMQTTTQGDKIFLELPPEFNQEARERVAAALHDNSWGAMPWNWGGGANAWVEGEHIAFNKKATDKITEITDAQVEAARKAVATSVEEIRRKDEVLQKLGFKPAEEGSHMYSHPEKFVTLEGAQPVLDALNYARPGIATAGFVPPTAEERAQGGVAKVVITIDASKLEDRTALDGALSQDIRKDIDAGRAKDAEVLDKMGREALKNQHEYTQKLAKLLDERENATPPKDAQEREKWDKDWDNKIRFAQEQASAGIMGPAARHLNLDKKVHVVTTPEIIEKLVDVKVAEALKKDASLRTAEEKAVGELKDLVKGFDPKKADSVDVAKLEEMVKTLKQSGESKHDAHSHVDPGELSRIPVQNFQTNEPAASGEKGGR